MSLSQDFYSYLCRKYPLLQTESSIDNVAPNLLSPHQMKFANSMRDSMVKTIEAFQFLRSSASFQAWAEKKWGPQFNPGNSGLFMSYDFHVTPENELKLIEINTNASFLILGWEMCEFQKIPWNGNFKIEDLKTCMEKELKSAKFSRPLKKIIITDEKPTEQKLYLEFLVYKEFFKSMGLECEIKDLNDLDASTSADLIYNRSTDFYLEQPQSQALRQIYLEKKSVVSPHPLEYRLLADKENFVEWNSPEFWQEVSIPEHHQKAIQAVLPKTKILNEANKAEIWAIRKNLFFKPKRAFGSKMAFKGSAVAHKVFDELVRNEVLAQELLPAPTVEFDQTYKYDLRCYAYEDQFQGAIARLYQGQLTNLRTEGGGFTPVIFQN